MGNKFKITIDGYGKVKVKKPAEYTDETIVATLAEVVTKTMNLVDRVRTEKFHPVLGRGGVWLSN